MKADSGTVVERYLYNMDQNMFAFQQLPKYSERENY